MLKSQSALAMAIALLVHGFVLGGLWFFGAATELPVVAVEQFGITRALATTSAAESLSTHAQHPSESDSNGEAILPGSVINSNNAPFAASPPTTAEQAAQPSASKHNASNGVSSTMNQSPSAATHNAASQPESDAGGNGSAEGLGRPARLELDAAACLQTHKAQAQGVGLNIAVKVVRTLHGAQWLGWVNQAGDQRMYAQEVKQAMSQLRFVHNRPECEGKTGQVWVRVQTG